MRHLLLILCLFVCFGNLFGANPKRNTSSDSEMIVSKLQTAFANALPRKMKDLPPERKVVVKTVQENKFQIHQLQTGTFFTLPENPDLWLSDPERLYAVSAELAAARLGYTGKVLPFPEPWFLRAVIREAFEIYYPMEYANFPSVRGMLYGGFAPNMKVFLENQSPERKLLTDDVFIEWSSVLYKICKRNHLVQSGDLENWIVMRLTDPKKMDSFECYQAFLYQKIIKRSRIISANAEITISNVFLTESPKIIFNRLDPAPAPLVEMLFRDVAAPLFGDYFKNLTKPYPVDKMNDMTQRIFILSEIASYSPEELSLPIRAFAKTLEQVRDGILSENIESQLSESAKRVYIAASRRNAVENILREKESRYVPFYTRFSLTFQAMQVEQPEIRTLQRAEELMNKYEKK